MKTTDKTFESRLRLREAAVNRWLAGQEIRVLDLGAGEGLLWKELRKKFTVSKYVAVDKTSAMPSTIGSVVDASLLMNLGLANFNVVDIETYSDALEIWLTVAMYVRTGTLVTLSVPRPHKEWLDRKSKALGGIPAEFVNVPANEKLWEWIGTAAIRRGGEYAHADETCLTFNHKGRVTGYAFWCPGRKP